MDEHQRQCSLIKSPLKVTSLQEAESPEPPFWCCMVLRSSVQVKRDLRSPKTFKHAFDFDSPMLHSENSRPQAGFFVCKSGGERIQQGFFNVTRILKDCPFPQPYLLFYVIIGERERALGNDMTDEQIVNLYWERNEAALSETQLKYEKQLLFVADNILSDVEDSKECLNDTLLNAWNSIPPQRPQKLLVYLIRLARQNAIDIYRKKNSFKRYASQHAVSLEELKECIPGSNDPEAELNKKLLNEVVNTFVEGLPDQKKQVFIGRYYYFDSIKQIAAYTGMSESAAKSMLMRLRQDLKEQLIKEGFGL